MPDYMARLQREEERGRLGKIGAGLVWDGVLLRQAQIKYYWSNKCEFK